mgnify:CR=1 FL=1
MVEDFNERNQLSCSDIFEKRYQEYDNELPRDEIISLALKNEVKNENDKDEEEVLMYFKK